MQVGHYAGPAANALPAAVRRTLRKHPHLNRVVQVGRAVVHFGPWRHLVRASLRVLHPPLAADSSPASSLFPPLAPSSVAAALGTDSVCVAGRLSPQVLGSIRAVTDQLPAGEYARFDEGNEDVYRLVRDEVATAVVREYFRAEPQLLECTLVVHETEDDARTPLNAQRYFHFDYAGWQSLNLFIYLSDVAADSGAHQIVTGSHRKKRLRDAVRPFLPDPEVERRFGERIRTIAGPAGTFFFENTEAFHRRLRMKQRRVMLNVLYASHRGVLSGGRLAPTYAAYVRSTQSRPRPGT